MDSGTVSKIDGINNNLKSTIKVGTGPFGIAVNPISNKIYVTNIGDNTVSVINGTTDQLVSTIKQLPTGIKPAGIAINTSTNRMYVTDLKSGSVFIIDTLTDKPVNTIKVGKIPAGLEVNPISNKIYVTNIGDNTVSVIDGKKNQTINTIAVNPILKANFKDNDPLKNLPVNVGFPDITSFVSIDPATNMVYVTNTASNTISMIDGNKDAASSKIEFQY